MIEQLFANYEDLIAKRQYLDWLGFTTKIDTIGNGTFLLRAFRTVSL